MLFFFKLLFLFLEVCPAPDLYFPFGLVSLYTVRYCDMTYTELTIVYYVNSARVIFLFNTLNKDKKIPGLYLK